MAHDMNIYLNIRLHSDAVAAIGIARRRGVGRIRHLDTADLWIQEKVRTQKVQLMKVEGANNPADLFTKYLPRADLDKHMKFIGLEQLQGRNEASPQLSI